ncbi:MAG: hypothetical protein Q4F57_00745 [Weeksellaceae bacterium]|nr:hypothetical protein [Weeksellaceae bacterium]
MRTPGEYSYTSLTLFFYDRQQDAFVDKYFELADQTGDAGYSEEKFSWLFKEGDTLRSYTYHNEKLEKIEPSDNTETFDRRNYYLVSLTPQKFDTLTTDSEKQQIFEQYWQNRNVK